jgi:hypothetical protein
MSKVKVRIRMYRPGLGDCFLLTFESGAKKSHIVIDCGIFNGTPNEKAHITEIAESIALETGGRVNAVVATHEHWDHVSGFVRAKEVFGDKTRFKFDEAWVAWTEDPNQDIATENKNHNMVMTHALALAVSRLEAADSLFDRECGRAVAQVIGFDGDIQLGAAFSVGSDQGMEFISKKADSYLDPGDIIERDWLPGIRIYVLGPPKDLEAIQNMAGKEGEGFESKKNGAAVAWAMAVGAVSSDEAGRQLRPFDEALAWPEAERSNDNEWMRALLSKYDAEPWRKIDNDWLLASANLALQVDNAINNTSLVLAFEIIETGDVLLFAGDAQIGNWKSWQERTFKIPGGGKVTTKELLERTIFYKVGHHGSGNATLRSGLAAMTSPKLVAAIPTDEKWASDVKGWEMPAPKLKPALRERTKGRIIRADPGRAAIRKPKAGISQAAWTRFAKSVTEEDLFVDYEVPGS